MLKVLTRPDEHNGGGACLSRRWAGTIPALCGGSERYSERLGRSARAVFARRKVFEVDGETLLGYQYLAVEFRASGRCRSSSVVPWPEVSDHEPAGTGLAGPATCLGGGHQVAHGSLGFALPVGGLDDEQVG